MSANQEPGDVIPLAPEEEETRTESTASLPQTALLNQRHVARSATGRMAHVGRPSASKGMKAMWQEGTDQETQTVAGLFLRIGGTIGQGNEAAN